MRNAYVDSLYELAKINKQIMSLNADIGAIVFDKFRKDFPDRFINCGVAEGNMISAAAGMAACGKIPFAYTITPFITSRTYEQIKLEVCLQNANVKIVGVGAGFVYSTLGPTHHATEDIAIMQALPNMKIVSPVDPIESREATFTIADTDGPFYFRLGTRGEPKINDDDYKFKLGKGVTLKDGDDVTIFSTGSITYDALNAANELDKNNISTRVVNIHTIKPIDKSIILKAANETSVILTVEEHNIIGGFGSTIASIILEGENSDIRFKRIGIDDCFCSYYGTHKELKSHYKISEDYIIKQTKKLLNDKDKIVLSS